MKKLIVILFFLPLIGFSQEPVEVEIAPGQTLLVTGDFPTSDTCDLKQVNRKLNRLLIKQDSIMKVLDSVFIYVKEVHAFQRKDWQYDFMIKALIEDGVLDSLIINVDQKEYIKDK